MSAHLHALAHGFNGLVHGYVIVWVPLVLGLHHRYALAFIRS